MDEHERADAARGDQPGTHDRLAEGSGGGQHAGVVCEHGVGGDSLLRPQLSLKSHVQRATCVAFVAECRMNAEAFERLPCLVEAASWQTDVMRVIFGAGDDARLVVGRHSHRLGLVELRILKSCQSKEAVPYARMQPFLGDVDLVPEDQLQR